MPVLTVSEDEIVELLTQLPLDARVRVLHRLESTSSFLIDGSFRSPDNEYSSDSHFIDFLDNLPMGPRSAKDWEAIEANFQEGRDSWDH